MALPDRVDCDALLKRAIFSARKATSLDHSGEYSDALALYESTVKDLAYYVQNEKCQSMVDCVMSKLSLYSNRARLLRSTLKDFDEGDYANDDLGNDDSFFASSSERRGYGTSTSSDSGMYEMSPGASSHNTTHEESGVADSSDREDTAGLDRSSQLSYPYENYSEYSEEDGDSTIYDVIVRTKKDNGDEQLENKRKFFQSCDRLVNNLLEMIQDGNMTEDEIVRTQEKLDRVLLLSQKYRKHYCSTDVEDVCQRLSRTTSIMSLPGPSLATEILQVTDNSPKSAESNLKPADSIFNPAENSFKPAASDCGSSCADAGSRQRGDHRQLVKVDVLHSAQEPLGTDTVLAETKARARYGSGHNRVAIEMTACGTANNADYHDYDDDDFPELPVDGCDEFSALQGSLTSLPIAEEKGRLLRHQRRIAVPTTTTTSTSLEKLDIIESATQVAPSIGDTTDSRPYYVTQALRRHHSMDSLAEIRGSPGCFWTLLNCLCG